jgi:hypothetical protein
MYCVDRSRPFWESICLARLTSFFVRDRIYIGSMLHEQLDVSHIAAPHSIE